MAIYNRKNFHRNTYCIFFEVNPTQILGNIDYKSKSGSEYRFTEEGVYRTSNHWGRAAKSKWKLVSNSDPVSRTKTGFAKWTAFHADNDFEKLYFICANESLTEVSFYHRDDDSAIEKSLLRTSSETTKRVKEIRNVIKNQAWLDYYDENERSNILKKVVEALIQTDIPLLSIRRNL